MAAKIELEILNLSTSVGNQTSHVLILGEKGGNRYFQMVIAQPEAQAINIILTNTPATRPLTHDLFRSFLEEFDIEINEVVITDLKEGVFHARIYAHQGAHKVELDCRPSDAIALGLKMNASFFILERIFNETAVEREETSSQQVVPSKAAPLNRAFASAKTFEEQLKDLTLDALNKLLDDSLTNEDYEKAAKVRDELSRRGY